MGPKSTKLSVKIKRKMQARTHRVDNLKDLMRQTGRVNNYTNVLKQASLKAISAY